jgi:hypothetical protein
VWFENILFLIPKDAPKIKCGDLNVFDSSFGMMAEKE